MCRVCDDFFFPALVFVALAPSFGKLDAPCQDATFGILDKLHCLDNWDNYLHYLDNWEGIA